MQTPFADLAFQFSWPKLVYSVLLACFIFVCLAELRRLWFDSNLYIRDFVVLTDGVGSEDQGKNFALRILDRHSELRQRFATAAAAEFKQENELSPTSGAPIQQSESVLSELSVTIQQIPITDILARLRRLVTTPKQVVGTVSQSGTAFRANIVISGDTVKLANGVDATPQIALFGMTTQDEAAFQIACTLIWREAAKQQIALANTSRSEFCNWSRKWVDYLNLMDADQASGGLSEDQIKDCVEIRKDLNTWIQRGAKYVRLLELRADVGDLLLANTTSLDDIKSLRADIQRDRILFRVRLKVDPHAAADPAKLALNPKAMQLVAGMRPALPFKEGKVDFEGLKAIDKELTTELAPQWKNILAPSVDSIEAAAKATGLFNITRKSKPGGWSSGTHMVGFAIAPSVIVTSAYNIDLQGVDTDSQKVIEFTDDWEGNFWFADAPPTDAAGAHRIKRMLIPGAASGSDLVFFEIERDGGSDHPPIELDKEAAKAVQDGDFVAVIGFPVSDNRLPPDLMEALLGSGPRIKRVMPGAMRAAQQGLTSGVPQSLSAEQLTFDANTTGGTGGGPLIDLKTGKVIGIHLGGRFDAAQYLKINSATSVSSTLNVADIIAAFQNAPVSLAALPPALQITNASKTVAQQLLSDLTAAGVKGYDPNFLGAKTVSLPTVPGAGKSLDYGHFSITMDGNHKLAAVAAVNIDGANLVELPRQNSVWMADPRLTDGEQLGGDWYLGPGFDRGNLVRRGYVSWGSKDAAALSERSTEFLTAVVPQAPQFNRRSWFALENHVFKYVSDNKLKATIFVGPWYDGDKAYRGEVVPRGYWKILVTVDPAGELRTAAYLLRQSFDLDENGVPVTDAPIFNQNVDRISVKKLQELTGINFGSLADTADLF